MLPIGLPSQHRLHIDNTRHNHHRNIHYRYKHDHRVVIVISITIKIIIVIITGTATASTFVSTSTTQLHPLLIICVVLMPPLKTVDWLSVNVDRSSFACVRRQRQSIQCNVARIIITTDANETNLKCNSNMKQ